MQPLYGVVLYDFQAERSDELDAKAGEPIIVIAQSNQEWFVAKPIGRLGGPGLIPVSFVEVRDAVTGKAITNVDMMHTAAPIPRVEEWKKMTQGYEASSISLGSMDNNKQQQNNYQQHLLRSGFSESPSSSISSATSDRIMKARQQGLLDDGIQGNNEQNPDTILDSYGMQHLAQASSLDPPPERTSAHSGTSPRESRSTRSDRPMVEAAVIDSYILEGDQYWFIVYARLNNGRHRVLYRLYEGIIILSRNKKKRLEIVEEK